MRFVVLFLLVLMMASSVFAISDVGLLDSQKTLAYFLLPSTDFANTSSGLVYNIENKDGSEVEIVYTSFRSVYLLTSNITQLDAYKKYKLTQLGPVGLTGVIGLGFMYSPAVGGGLYGDFGTVITLGILNDLAFSLPLYMSWFQDGSMMNFYANLNYTPPFMKGYEIFGGYKLDGRTTDNIFASESIGSGTMTNYYTLGIRSAL